MTRVEMLRGVRSHERRVTERLLATIRWVGVDEEISVRHFPMFPGLEPAYRR